MLEANGEAKIIDAKALMRHRKTISAKHQDMLFIQTRNMSIEIEYYIRFSLTAVASLRTLEW